MGGILTIVAGGLAGVIAVKIMKVSSGLVMNIVLGVAGAVVMNFVLDRLGVPPLGPDFINDIIKGIAGAGLLIFAFRMMNESG